MYIHYPLSSAHPHPHHRRIISGLWLLLYTCWISSASAGSGASKRLPQLGDPDSQTTTPPVAAHERQLAQLLQQGATLLAADAPRHPAKAHLANVTSQLINQQSERWLGPLGRVRATLSIDQNFKSFHGGLALLMPLNKTTQQRLTFTQLRIDSHDRQRIAALGLGQRHPVANWLLGYNGFVDYDLRNTHVRGSLGAEVWGDCLRFSGNSYFPISRWKTSKQRVGYHERPAAGFDLYAQWYWPSYRHIEGRLRYEHYLGQALEQLNEQQWNNNLIPFTAGIHYTPVPLLTVGIEHQMGHGKQHNTRINLQLDYALATPLSRQLDSTQVTAQRSLTASRYDWVARQQRIVMQSRYQQTQRANCIPPAQRVVRVSPSDSYFTLEGQPGETIVVELPIDDKLETVSVFPEDEDFMDDIIRNGGHVKPVAGNGKQLTIKFPQHPFLYGLAVEIVDAKGEVVACYRGLLKVSQDPTYAPPSKGTLTISLTNDKTLPTIWLFNAPPLELIVTGGNAPYRWVSHRVGEIAETANNGTKSMMNDKWYQSAFAGDIITVTDKDGQWGTLALPPRPVLGMDEEPEPLTYDEAKSFCQYHGARLPTRGEIIAANREWIPWNNNLRRPLKKWRFDITEQENDPHIWVEDRESRKIHTFDLATSHFKSFRNKGSQNGVICLFDPR